MIRGFYDRAAFWACAIGLLLGAAGTLLADAAAEPTTARADEDTALKIGLLLDLSSGSAEVYRDRQRAFELAIEHVNQGGGVFCLPVTVAVADATADPDKAVAAARHLVEVEGVHAIVGPNASASALPVAERVIGPAGVPTVSFSATSPALTAVADDDFLFRTTLSDVSQGPVLARLARERGFDNVGLLHVDETRGRGLAGAFEAAWDGPIMVFDHSLLRQALRRGQPGRSPSWFTAVPRITPQIRSPAASASSRRLRTSIPQPSLRTKPSARSPNVQHRPEGDSIPALANASVVNGERITHTPPASARSASPRCRPATAWCTATSDEEQAVSTAIEGPSGPNAKEIRPLAVLKRLPVTR